MTSSAVFVSLNGERYRNRRVVVHHLMTLVHMSIIQSLSVLNLALSDVVTSDLPAGAPSVFRCHLNLLSRYSVDYVMYEVQSIIKDLSPTIVPRAFKIVKGRSTDAPLEGIPYHPCRHPVQV